MQSVVQHSRVGTAPVIEQWPFYFSYDSDYVGWDCAHLEYPPDASDIPLYAPIPVSGPEQAALVAVGTSDLQSMFTAVKTDMCHEDECKPSPTEAENPLDFFLDAPQVLFPTPSELLADLNTGEGVSRTDASSPEKASPSETSSSCSTLGKRKRDACEKHEHLNQRKAYFRAVSHNVGFRITDPDTITSHDKKRSYLECLEEYVQWLHEKISLAGHEPLPLRRIPSYPGLQPSSLRTMLVHMQDTIKDRNLRKLQAEKRFMELHNAVLNMRQPAEEPLQFRRHSVAMGAVPHGLASHLR